MTEIIFKKKVDNRGSLIAIDSEFDLPFNIKRIFYITDLDNLERGFHAHKKCEQIVIPIKGSFELSLDNGKTINKYLLNNNNKGIHIPLFNWIQMSNFSMDCIIMVICSYKYDECEYIRDYNVFLKEIEKYDSIIENFSLNKQTKMLKRRYLSKLENIIDENAFVMSKEVKDFEDKFAKFNVVKNCIAVSNGCSALKIAIKSLKLKNPKILVQANTYVAVPLVCEELQYSYEIIDIDNNLLLDIEKLEQYLIENQDKTIDFVIVIVHLYGNSLNWDKLYKLREMYNFKIIEDAAQAHGSTYKDKFLGTYGDLGCFSFYPSKNLGALGEGGAIITNNDIYADFCRYYRNYGSIEKYKWKIIGANERINNIQGGILSIKLDFLNEWNDNRRKLANIYIENLKENNEFKILKPINNCNSNIHLFVVIVNRRDELMEYLNKKNIKCAIHYPIPFYESEAYKEKEVNNCPTMDLYKYKLLSLPMYPELSKEKVIKVCDEINTFYKLLTI